MSRLVKIIILSTIGCALIVILAGPYLFKTHKYDKFQVTPKAAATLDKSLAKSRPVFLEFYASW